MEKKKVNTRRIAETAAFVAIAVVLSMITFLPMPFGGSVTLLSMLPIVLISYRFGVKTGLCAGLVFGLSNILTGYHTVSAMFLPGDDRQPLLAAILIILLDYIVAYTVLGFSGMFRKRMKPSGALCLGSVVGLGLRYLVHTVSGVIFYGAWAEWFFSQDTLGTAGSYILQHCSGFGLSVLYSLFYNGTYMIPEMIFTAVAAIFIGKIPLLQKTEM